MSLLAHDSPTFGQSVVSTPATDTIDGDAGRPEVSVVMPCLNEAETLATCITKAQQALRKQRLSRWPLGAQYQVLCQKPR